MKHLAKLSGVTQTALTGATIADMVKAYTEGGWRADAAVLDALAAVSHPQDRNEGGPRRKRLRPRPADED
jgi:hypothetical protein